MNKYWFSKRRGLKTKDLGWGWIPVTREGWLLVISILVLIAISARTFFGEIVTTNADPAIANVLLFLGTVSTLIIIGAIVSYKKTRP